MSQDYLECIIDEAVTFVCMNPAGMVVHRLDGPSHLPGERMGLTASIQGDYRLALHLLLGVELCGRIAANMIHNNNSEPEIQVDCLREFFNILCGRIVSLYNRRMNACARFPIPSELPPEKLSEICNGTLRSICYGSEHGELQLLYLLQPNGATAPEPAIRNRKGAFNNE